MDGLFLGVSQLGEASEKHRCGGDVLSGSSKLREVIPPSQDVALDLASAGSCAACLVARVRCGVMHWARRWRQLRVLLALAQLVAVHLRLRQGLYTVVRQGVSLIADAGIVALELLVAEIVEGGRSIVRHFHELTGVRR